MVLEVFCPICGNQLRNEFIELEGRERLICSLGHIHYINPKVVAGTIPSANGRIWLLRRGIEPRYGSWTFPAGFMEMGETVEEAAVRETTEELGIEIRLGELVGIFSLARMTTVHIIYDAEALTEPRGGSETLEFASFTPEKIPWTDLAFWSTQQALKAWVQRSDSMAGLGM